MSGKILPFVRPTKAALSHRPTAPKPTAMQPPRAPSMQTGAHPFAATQQSAPLRRLSAVQDAAPANAAVLRDINAKLYRLAELDAGVFADGRSAENEARDRKRERDALVAATATLVGATPGAAAHLASLALAQAMPVRVKRVTLQQLLRLGKEQPGSLDAALSRVVLEIDAAYQRGVMDMRRGKHGGSIKGLGGTDLVQLSDAQKTFGSLVRFVADAKVTSQPVRDALAALAMRIVRDVRRLESESFLGSCFESTLVALARQGDATTTLKPILDEMNRAPVFDQGDCLARLLKVVNREGVDGRALASSVARHYRGQVLPQLERADPEDRAAFRDGIVEAVSFLSKVAPSTPSLLSDILSTQMARAGDQPLPPMAWFWLEMSVEVAAALQKKGTFTRADLASFYAAMAKLVADAEQFGPYDAQPHIFDNPHTVLRYMLFVPMGGNESFLDPVVERIATHPMLNESCRLSAQIVLKELGAG